MVELHHPDDVLQPLVTDVPPPYTWVQELLTERAYAHVGALRDEEGVAPRWASNCATAVAPQASDCADYRGLADAAFPRYQQRLPEHDAHRHRSQKGAARSLHLQRCLQDHVLELKHNISHLSVHQRDVTPPLLSQILRRCTADLTHRNHQLPEPFHAQLPLHSPNTIPANTGCETAGISEQVLRRLALTKRYGALQNHGVVHTHQP
mmetsp:Transcript_51929/g.166244  ORF Transcript_51929/g.166244 Transcript_51929/m.166244 type:complete len:207 (+) Transcript_51929:679-1299(+)